MDEMDKMEKENNPISISRFTFCEQFFSFKYVDIKPDHTQRKYVDWKSLETKMNRNFEIREINEIYFESKFVNVIEV